MSFIFIFGFQNHLSSVPSGRKWREESERLEAEYFISTRRGSDLEISGKSVGNSEKWGGVIQGLQGRGGGRGWKGKRDDEKGEKG